MTRSSGAPSASFTTTTARSNQQRVQLHHTRRKQQQRFLARTGTVCGILSIITACVVLHSQAVQSHSPIHRLVSPSDQVSSQQTDASEIFSTNYQPFRTYQSVGAPDSYLPHPTFFEAMVPSDAKSASSETKAASSTTSVGNHSHSSISFDSMRDSMLGSKWISNTDQSGSNSMSFLRNFPRHGVDGKSRPNQLQRIGGPPNTTFDEQTPAEQDAIADYAAGMFFMWGVPILFAMIAIICWFGFCIARCWCNVCGRHATQLYTDKQININYVLIVILITLMGICTAFGWTGNVEVSQGVDSTFIAMDLLANYFYEFMGVFSTAYAIGYDATLLGASFNSTLSLLPEDSVIQGQQNCTNASYTQLQTQKSFVVTLQQTTQYFTDNIAYTVAQNESATGVGQVATAQAQLSVAQTITPPDGVNGNTMLQNLQKQLSDINSSFAGLPSVSQIDSLVTDLTTIQGYSTAGSTLAAINTLAAEFTTFYHAANDVAPLLNTAISSAYKLVESGSTQLQCPTFGSTNSQCTTIQTAISGTTPSNTATSNGRGSLTISYGDVLGGIGLFPSDMTAFQTDMLHFQKNLTTLNSTLATLTSDITAYQSTITVAAGWPATSTAYSNAANEISSLANFEINFGAALQTILVTELPTLIVSIQNMQTGIPRAIAAFNTTQNQVNDVRNYVDTDTVSNVIRQFNASLELVNCFQDVFDLVSFVNSTFVIVPYSVTKLTQDVQPLIEQQVADLPIIYQHMNESIQQLMIVNHTVDPSQQIDYTGLTTALTNLLTAVNSMSNYSLLFEELLVLQNQLYTLTTANGVNVTRLTSSNQTALWGDVVSVIAIDNTDRFSSLTSFLNIYTNLQMSAALGRLNSVISSLQTQLSTSLSAAVVASYVSSVNSIAGGLSAASYRINSVLPLNASSLPQATCDTIVNALTALQTALVKRPDSSAFQTELTTLNTTLVTPTSPSLSDVAAAVLGINSALTVLPNMAPLLYNLQPNATTTAQPTLQQVLTTNELIALNTAFQSSGTEIPDNNALIQTMASSYLLPGVNGLLYTLNHPTLFISSSDRDSLISNLGKFLGIRGALPDFNSQIEQGISGVQSISDALSWMEGKKQQYQKTKGDFQITIDKYDGVRLLVFNLGVLLPFVLSFLLLIAAIQHSGCPAMVAGLVFFPMFVLFMVMTAVQVPLSVALADHCYNTTGEIKVQTLGRTYPAANLMFFNLSSDVDISGITDYFTSCIGSPPEMLVKMNDPIALLKANNYESSQIQANAYAAIGLPFADPLAEDFVALDALQQRTLDLFTLGVSKLNCTRSSSIYESALHAICTDFGPPFALTTCVFLFTAICMVPGICLGITSYKRFNPLNRDTHYTKASTQEDLPHEGWN